MEIIEKKGDKNLKIRDVDFTSQNCKWHTIWEIEIAGITSKFSTSDVKKGDIGAYIEFSEYSKIAEYFAKLTNQKVKDLRLRISNETYEAILKTEQENYSKRLQEELDKELKTWSWWLDENYQICIYSDDVDFTLRTDVKQIMDFIERHQSEFKQYLKENSEYNEKKQQYTITNEKLMKLYNQIKNSYDDKIQKQAKDEKELRDTLIQIAKETGELQTIRSWTEDCDGSVQDCDCDRVYEKIDGEGKISLHRVHTF